MFLCCRWPHFLVSFFSLENNKINNDLSSAYFSFIRWGYDKFPKETPLVFFKDGKPIHPSLEMFDGLKVVLENMVSHIEKAFPKKVLKFWRLQSPRHFHGGDWNQDGSCLFDEPLEESQVN